MAEYPIITELLLYGESFVGMRENSQQFKQFVNGYNTIKPLPRGYRLKCSDEWCAAFLSYLSFKRGSLAALPAECSCVQMRKKLLENGATEIKAKSDTDLKAGDIVFYRFKKASPTHVGIIDSYPRVSGVKGRMWKVLEGNKNETVDFRYIHFNDKTVHSFIRPAWENVSRETIDPDIIELGEYVDVANDVIKGRYGNMPERKERVERAGYDYETVQHMVNQLMRTNV